MDDIKEAVLGPDYEGTVVDREILDGRVDVMVNTFNGKIYFMDGNLSHKQEEIVVFTVDKNANALVEVYGENRTIAVNNGVFIDSFSPLGIHIYIYTPDIVNGVESSSSQPYNYALHQNYPNPFNPTTKINYTIPQQSKVTLKVYEFLGRKIETLVNVVKSPAEHTVEWNGTNSNAQQVASGVYFYQLKTSSGYIYTRKMILAK